jgi:hypothetical protein
MFEELKITASRYTIKPIRKIYYYIVRIVLMLTIVSIPYSSMQKFFSRLRPLLCPGIFKVVHGWMFDLLVVKEHQHTPWKSFKGNSVLLFRQNEFTFTL